MLTTKQRASLRALANPLEPSMQIGKEGLSENSFVQIEQLFEAKELIKMKVLPSAPLSPRMMLTEIAARTGCESIQSIGSVIVAYRRSKRKEINHIQF